MTMELRTRQVGPWSMNTYALVCPETRQSVLFDPGDDPDILSEMLVGTLPVAILLTHTHPDHIGALDEMRRRLGVPLGAFDGPHLNGLTLAEIKEILNAHNSARAEQQLPPVTWDCRLAELAQEWANQSIYEHRDDSSYGENIFVSGSSTEPIASVVKRWMLEKPNWNNETATCAAGKVCTHYAQVMWRTTKSIGCGINRSATGKWKAIVVCNYDPASKASGPAW